MSRARTLAALAAAGVTAAGLGSGTALSLGQEDPPASTAPEATTDTTPAPPETTSTGPPAADPAAPPEPEPAPHPAPGPPADDRPQPGDVPTVTGGDRQHASGHKRREPAPDPEAEAPGRDAEQRAAADRRARTLARARLRAERRAAGKQDDHEGGGAGAPSPDDPDYTLSLPGSAPVGVPDFFIEKFRIPPFLLPIYQAAGIQYGIRWELLAAINEIETDYGRNLHVSSAGAQGWMQFMPATWRRYGVDANADGEKDPYNPVDAIFGAARYLRAAGGEADVRKAVFAYNHADWYVDSVLMRARLIGGLPADLVGSLTGLTEGRFPVAARTTYGEGGRAAAKGRRHLDLFAKAGSPVVATQDGEVVARGRNAKLGTYLKLRDVYGNTYTYAQLGSIEARFPAPRRSGRDSATDHDDPPRDPVPTAAATGGTQPDAAPEKAPVTRRALEPVAGATGTAKERVFANPTRARAWKAGGDRQADAPSATQYTPYAQRLLGLPRGQVVLKRLRVGATVPGGTVLGHVGAGTAARGAHVRFVIRPAGRGAPQIDPKPILDGWKLLESTAIYRAAGRNALLDDGGTASIGRILLERKELLQRRVLADPHIGLHGCGREDVAAGLIDRRVLATLAFLSASGLRPGVSALRCDHGVYTASGNVSAHSSGNAVDIPTINGIPIAGHQGPGSVTELTIRRLLTLQGTMRPAQIISLMTFSGADNAFALPDHDDHIHVGFSPAAAGTGRPGVGAVQGTLKAGQWDDLITRLNAIDLPSVATGASAFALPVRGKATTLATR